jgi:exonuclease III
LPQTFFKEGKGRHQLDYLYSTASLTKLATKCWVVPYGEVEVFSDHAPLVAELVVV